ncbi:MAG: general secretion pathway protein GspK, partial [Desulfobacterales bacterium]|nr:general secretion pathway protein GspK [Desulfobacterales bacterium]
MIDRWKNNRGIALFIVLWVLMLLWVIVGEFSFTVRSQINIVGNFKDATKARYYAVAGVNQAVASIIAYNASQSGKERDTLEREISAEIDQASEGGYSVKILNENGKININTANKRLLEVMLMAARVDETLESVIVDSILDWRDENDLHRSNGAENDYYQGLENPYKCRNGDFRATNELLLV